MRAAFFLLLFSLLHLAAGLTGAAPVFRPSDESFPLIRRDLIPLDISAIKNLANDLTTLADTPVKQTGVELRERAQLLTLTLRLSPSQSRAREMERSLLKKSFKASINNPDLKEARGRALDTAKWLITLPPESEGSLLGELLLDVLTPFQKNHSLIKDRDLSSIDERWSGVIAPLAEFEPPPPPVTPPKDKPTASEYLTTALLTTTPLLTELDGQQTLGAVNVSLILTKNNNLSQLRFKPELTTNGRSRSSEPLHNDLKAFFTAQDRPLPDNYDLFLDTGRGSYSERNKTNILAPVAMMLDAALTGRELARNVLIFGKLEADGSLTRPAGSWPLLHSLKDKNPLPGTRLLVPSTLAEELTAILVLEEPGFLLRFEIIACDSLTEARQLYLTDAEPPTDLAAASKAFQEVAEALRRTSDGNLASSLVYDSVKSRLMSAAAASPRHLSANILLKQASGKRPSSFSTPMFAREMLRLTSTLSQVPKIEFNSGSRPLKTFHKEQRDILENFRERRRIGRDDKEVLTSGIDLIDKLRPIIRLIEKNEGITGAVQLVAWRAEAILFRQRLQRLSGDITD
ncbi:MAG: hypothetical protein ABF377_06360 [Akkermansiaceae bacterium]